MNPVLFLDVDGVLTISRGLLENYSPGDPTLYYVSDLVPELAGNITPIERDRMVNLRRVVDAVPHLRIVVSSSWREDAEYMAFLIAAMKATGIDVDAMDIDQTPILTGVGRGVEVLQWLEMNPGHDVYVVVDDGHFDSFEECGISARVIQTYIGCSESEQEGITLDRATQIIRMFESQLLEQQAISGAAS